VQKRYRRGSDEGVICLLLVVVRISDCRESEDGRYEATLSVRSEIVEVDANENETVAGSESPGNDDSRTLTFDDAILKCGRKISSTERAS
jgi:hypothetical protein